MWRASVTLNIGCSSRNRSAAEDLDGPYKIEEIALLYPQRGSRSPSPTGTAPLNVRAQQSVGRSRPVRAHHARVDFVDVSHYTRDGSLRRFFRVFLGNLRNRGRGCARGRARERGIMRRKMEHGRPHVSEEKEEEEEEERGERCRNFVCACNGHATAPRLAVGYTTHVQ